MEKSKLEQLKALLTEYRNSDYFGLGEMEQIEFIDGLIYQLNENINEVDIYNPIETPEAHIKRLNNEI